MRTLRTPPLLIGAALLFWGWQAGLPLVGALLAVLIESARLIDLRWELSDKDFRRIWDFTGLLALTVLVYLFAANQGGTAVKDLFTDSSAAAQNRMMMQSARAFLLLFMWGPVIFFLFAGAQAYSTREALPWSVFSLWHRRRAARLKPSDEREPAVVNAAYPYFAICLLASSVAVESRRTFFPGCAVLLGWALWSQRSRRYRPALWAAMLGLGLAGGFLVQLGLYELTSWANVRSANWLAQYMFGGPDPLETRTALGQIGRLKLSGRIVVRVETAEGRSPPALLREASYQFFKSPEWAASPRAREFQHALSETNTWDLAGPGESPHSVRLSQYLTGRGQDARRGLLAVPQGIVRLENLGAFLLSTNRLGIVRVDEGPGLVTYDAFYRAASTLDMPPEKDDLGVPSNEERALSTVTNDLRLAGKSAHEVLRSVAGFFQDHFSYSTWLSAPRPGQTNLTAVSNFLLHTRSGHCEYFATAAVLLLRKAGVPARYAVGYSVQEGKAGYYVVRQRHAHAWCLAWVDGAWRDFDATPASWLEAESAQASKLERLSDAWARVWFEFSRWRYGQTSLRKYIVWIFGPILAGLLVRLFLGKRWSRLRERITGPRLVASYPGLDSEFYQLEREMARQGLGRQPFETPLDWLEHIENPGLRGQLREVLSLHYRYRFDPSGLDREEREALRRSVRECLARLRGDGAA